MNDSLINSSFKYCENMAREHYENFPVASLLIPKDKRKYIFSIYAFARAADDFADEPLIEGGDEKRLALLDEWNEKLRDSSKGKAYDPIFIALGRTISDCSIPLKPLEDLLNAFRSDVVKKRYETFEEVLSYCRNSANPVGRLVLTVFGFRDEEMFKLSDNICTALQLTNFWQDLEIDLKKDRVYIPAGDFKQFGYSYDELFQKKVNDNFKDLIKFQVERTEKLFSEGKPLIGLLASTPGSGKLVKELKLTWKGGFRILQKIKENNYDVLTKRPVISAADKIKMFLSSRFK